MPAGFLLLHIREVCVVAVTMGVVLGWVSAYFSLFFFFFFLRARTTSFLHPVGNSEKSPGGDEAWTEPPDSGLQGPLRGAAGEEAGKDAPTCSEAASAARSQVYTGSRLPLGLLQGRGAGLFGASTRRLLPEPT